MARVVLDDDDYRRLLMLRTGLRQYFNWSEQQAQAVGLTPAHHQLLLAIRGHDDPRGPTIGDVARYLLLRHHSTVELVQRVGSLDLIRRVEDPDDRRIVRLAVTDKGATALEQLASLHLVELSRLAGDLAPLWQGQISPRPMGRKELAAAGEPGTATDPCPSYPVRARRMSDAREEQDGTRVLVDRLWPRGVNKGDAPIDEWCTDVAPSTELRRWYGHKAERFPEFADRYRDELRNGKASAARDRLAGLARRGPVTLLTSSRNLARSGAAVLAGEICDRSSSVTSQ